MPVRQVNVAAVALKGCCPRCTNAPILDGLLTLKPACPACGLDLSGYQQGDGPAFFVITIVGAIMVPLALWMASAFSLTGLPYLLITGSITTVLVLALLRVAKGLLIAMQYRQDAGEGVLVDQEGRDD